MKPIPYPLVQPGPTSKQVGASLARLIATMRKMQQAPQTTAASFEQETTNNQKAAQ